MGGGGGEEVEGGAVEVQGGDEGLEREAECGGAGDEGGGEEGERAEDGLGRVSGGGWREERGLTTVVRSRARRVRSEVR